MPVTFAAVSILLCLDTGWKLEIIFVNSEEAAVSILLCLDTGWKPIYKSKRFRESGFNPLMSGYGLEAFYKLLGFENEKVSILLCLDTGWKGHKIYLQGSVRLVSILLCLDTGWKVI